jgi:polyisoprenoid-binding protein YceI
MTLLIRSAFAVPMLLAVPAMAQDTRLELDPAATKVDFSVVSTLHTVHGTFHLKRGSMWFNPATGVAGGEMLVDAASGASGNDSRDGRMHKEILESPKFTEIRFVPDRIDGTVNMAGDSAIKLHGALTLHGGTHQVTMAANSHIEGGRITANINFPVPYIQWGLKNPSNFLLKVKDTVDIHIEAAGKVAAAAAVAHAR